MAPDLRICTHHLSTGERVQWFRAEAEMERWREQWEIKISEFIRCSRSFETMSKTWSQLAETHGSPVYAVYARKQACKYRRMKTQVDDAFARTQVDEPIKYTPGDDLVDFIIRHRRVEIGDFHPSHR